MLKRNEFGAIIKTADTPTEIQALVETAKAMALQAAGKAKIPGAFDDMSWGTSGRERNHRIGTARYHEIYDVTPDAKKALVCVRAVEGTKYGIKTTCKTYFLIRKHGAGLRVSEASKAVAAKLAKNAETLGAAIAALS